MSKSIDLWLGPDIEERLAGLIRGLIDETRSFNTREFAEKYFLVSTPPSAILERCEDREELILCCRKGPRSVVLYALQVQSGIGIGSLITSAIGPDERSHLIMIFDEVDSLKWPTTEAELEQIENTFGDAFPRLATPVITLDRSGSELSGDVSGGR